jgi:hypothetical protein
VRTFKFVIARSPCDEAIQASSRRRCTGLLRFARNDVERSAETREFVIARNSCELSVIDAPFVEAQPVGRIGAEGVAMRSGMARGGILRRTMADGLSPLQNRSTQPRGTRFHEIIQPSSPGPLTGDPVLQSADVRLRSSGILGHPLTAGALRRTAAGGDDPDTSSQAARRSISWNQSTRRGHPRLCCGQDAPKAVAGC